MFGRTIRVVIVSVALLGGVFIVSAQEKSPTRGKDQEQRPVRYKAEEGLPGDKAGEKRRDYAVLEAALNDLASPKNPEYKFHIENVGPGREIVIGDGTLLAGDLMFADPQREDVNIVGEDPRRIPAEIQQHFKSRNKGPAWSLKDFKPANPDILVRDLDKEFKDSSDFVGDFLKKYHTAWGYVWAYPPGYSRDGKSALVVFEGGPNGTHGLDWTYLLTRDRDRWLVVWGHCHPRE